MADISDAFGVISSKGVKLSQYQLVLDPQGGLTGISWNSMMLGLANILWAIYKVIAGFVLWLVNMSAEFGWLDFVREGINGIVSPLQTVIITIGVVPFLIALAAGISGIMLLTGRIASGLVEMLTSSTILALFFTTLANPVNLITGNDGLIIKARDAGIELSDQIAGGSGKAQAGARLTDIFVDLPAQLITFGRSLSASCADVWRDGLKKLPTDADLAGMVSTPIGTVGQPGREITTAEGVQQAVLGCDSSITFSSGPGALITTGILTPSILVLMLISLVLAGGLLYQAAVAIIDAIKLIYQTPRAIPAGEGRTKFLQTLVSLAFAVLGVGGLLVLLSAQLELLELLFINATKPKISGGGGWNPILTFFLLDVIIVVLAVRLAIGIQRSRRNAAEKGERWAKKLGGKNAQQQPSMIAAAKKQAVHHVHARRAATMTAAALGGPAAAAGVSKLGQALNGSGTDEPARTRREALSGAAHRVGGAARHVGGAAAGLGKVGWGLTLGAPVSVPRWTRAGMNAVGEQKRALQDKIAAAKTTAGARMAAGGERVTAASESVRAYGREYAHNLSAPVRAANHLLSSDRATEPEFTHQPHAASPFQSGRKSQPVMPQPGQAMTGQRATDAHPGQAAASEHARSTGSAAGRERGPIQVDESGLFVDGVANFGTFTGSTSGPVFSPAAGMPGDGGRGGSGSGGDHGPDNGGNKGDDEGGDAGGDGQGTGGQSRPAGNGSVFQAGVNVNGLVNNGHLEGPTVVQNGQVITPQAQATQQRLKARLGEPSRIQGWTK